MEKTVENLDAYIERMKVIKAKAEELYEELETLDEEFIDPHGINQDVIEEAQEDGIDWESECYSPLQEMEIYSLPANLEEWIDTFITDKESLCCKKKNDNVYRALFYDMYNLKAKCGIDPVMMTEKEFGDLYDTLYMIVNTGTKEDFIKHMFKTALKENH